jgi:hypothetical protein
MCEDEGMTGSGDNCLCGPLGQSIGGDSQTILPKYELKKSTKPISLLT